MKYEFDIKTFYILQIYLSYFFLHMSNILSTYYHMSMQKYNINMYPQYTTK